MEGTCPTGERAPGRVPAAPSEPERSQSVRLPVTAPMGRTLAKQPHPVSEWRLRSGQVKTRRESDSGERRAMAHTIVGSLLPVVITLLLGFVAARRHDFSQQQAAILNRLALRYALPLMLFVGTVSTSPTELRQAVPLLVALFVGIVGIYAIVFLLSRFVFAARMSTSALAAMTASAPAVPFMGPAILAYLFGQSSAIAIATGGLVINLTVVPATILLLTLDPVADSSSEKNVPTEDAKHQLPRASGLSTVLRSLKETVREPMVWAPVLGLAVALTGWRVPALALHALSLLGHATGGVSLFAAGIVLASVKISLSKSVVLLVLLKNIVQPALVLVGLWAVGIGNPLRSEAALTTAIPVMPIVVMLALQYRVAQTLAAGALFFSVIASVITLAAFIAVTS
jgi:malonate transporter